MRDRIDISEVEARTKIRAKYLRAIENEEWDLLPGPVYAKSFLRTYGDFLGLDSRMLLDEFKRRYERPSDHDVRIGSIAARDRDRRPPRRLPGWAPIAIVLVLIVAILFVVGSLAGSNTTSTIAQKPPARRHAHRTGPAKPTVVAPSATATLKLVPTALVYVCLVNGRGTKLIDEQTFNVGDTIPTETARKLLLTLGNASVQMKVNGKSVPVTPSPNAIRLLITPTGITPIPASQTPTCP